MAGCSFAAEVGLGAATPAIDGACATETSTPITMPSDHEKLMRLVYSAKHHGLIGAEPNLIDDAAATVDCDAVPC